MYFYIIIMQKLIKHSRIRLQYSIQMNINISKFSSVRLYKYETMNAAGNHVNGQMEGLSENKEYYEK